jgi:hypothetical protein
MVGFKILTFFVAYPLRDLGSGAFLILDRGSGMENSGPGSGINIQDPQHSLKCSCF